MESDNVNEIEAQEQIPSICGINLWVILEAYYSTTVYVNNVVPYAKN